MRILIPVALCLLTACGSPEPSDKTEIQTDTVMSANTTPEAANNTLTAAEQAEGWQLLFNGSSNAGWHAYNKNSDASAWKIQDGALFLDSNNKKDGKPFGRGDIITDEEYSNFHLKLEWKIGPAGNSGIIFFVKEDPKYDATFFTGPEMQVLDNAGHSDGKIEKHHAGDLYDLIAGSPETVKPVGEWNLAEIISNNGALEFRFNGSSIVKTTLWDDNWKKMVAASKFKQWPDFGTYKTGRIALQDHGDPVWYRNIKIKKLQ